MLAAMIRTLFEERLTDTTRVASFTKGIDALVRAVQPFSPERVAPACGIDADTIVELARDFASASSAVCYGRMGTSTQSFGTLTTCLIDVLNLVSGNLDRAGGAMLTTPAVDLAGIAAMLGQRGSFGRWNSRVSELPEFNGELPVAALTEEIDTPGERQLRGLVVHAGNPVLSLPDGNKLDAALAKLDFIVAVDIYLNETTRHADLILPSSFGFEHEHYPLLAYGLAIRNATKFAPAVMPAPPDVRHDWEIFLGLARGILGARGIAGRVGAKVLDAVAGRGPRSMLSLAVRTGPHGFRGRGLTWKQVENAPHGIDLGALQPQFPGGLQTTDKCIDAWPEVIATDINRLQKALSAPPRRLTLISRRHLRCNNSWMHNSRRLLKGPARCTLQLHPSDAEERGVADGELAELRTSVGSVQVEIAVTDEMMEGVASLPHGWGHSRRGAKLGVASNRPGVSINDITASHAVDPVSGCTSFAIDCDVMPIAESHAAE